MEEATPEEFAAIYAEWWAQAQISWPGLSELEFGIALEEISDTFPAGPPVNEIGAALYQQLIRRFGPPRVD